MNESYFESGNHCKRIDSSRVWYNYAKSFICITKLIERWNMKIPVKIISEILINVLDHKSNRKNKKKQAPYG